MKFSFVYLSVLHERAYIIRSFIGCVTHSRSYARGVGSRFRLTLPLLRYTTSSSWGGSSGAFTRRLRMFDTMWNLIVVNKSSVDEDLVSCLVCMYIYIYWGVQLNYIRFRIASKWRWVYGSFWLTGKRCIEGWATGFIHFPRQVWNWFRDTCNENNWGEDLYRDMIVEI